MLDGEHDLPVLNLGESGRRDVVGTVLRDEDQVRMRNSIPMYDHSYPLRLKHLPHSTPDVLRHTHDSLGGSVLDVSKMVDMGKRNYGALPRRRGMDSHEGDDELVPIDDTGG